MRKIEIIICCVWLVLVTAGTSSAKGWRGLVPLQSTRQDVERLLGMPTDSYYDLRNETVYIYFSSGRCQDGPDSYKVPANLVVQILVIPKSERPLNALGIDISKHKKKADEDIKQHVFYYDEEAGEAIEVFDGKVQSLAYAPTASAASLRCYSSVEDWMTANNVACVLRAQKFDQFGALSISDERARLGNLAIQLKNSPPKSRGWIMVYGVKKDGTKSAIRRAKRIKNFFVKQGLASGRVLTMAAGIHDEQHVELWISSVGQSLHTSSLMERRKY